MKTRSDSNLVLFGLVTASIFLPLLGRGQSTSSKVLPAEISIRVDAGDLDRAAGTPLQFELPAAAGIRAPAMLWPANGAGFHVQVDGIDDESVRISWLLQKPLKAGEGRAYQLRNGLASNAFRYGGQVSVLDERIIVSVPADSEGPKGTIRSGQAVFPGRPPVDMDVGRRIFDYVKVPTADAENNDPLYSRSGYIHPLYSPGGKSITGDYPVDHPHQHALFFAWTNCTFEGRDINFWDQKKGVARIRFVSAGATEVIQGPAFTEFTVSHCHEDLSAPGETPKPVLDETWRVRTWRPEGEHFVIDIVSTQTCASDSPLTINKYHYGGMAIRGTADWFINEKDATQPGDFLTSERKTRADGNHSRPKWVDMHGPYQDASHAGVAILCHPDNFRFPQWVRLHPSKPYFVFTPQVEEGFQIKPGEPYVSRYRYIVHDGKPDPKLLDRLWNDYATPPEVVVTGKVQQGRAAAAQPERP